MPETASTAKQDRVRELQRTLYRAAKADPGRRFHALYDKVYRRDVLERAWEQVRRNRGAAGIDHITIDDIVQSGYGRLLDELAAELKEHRFRPAPARRVWIPKPGSSQQRPLSIPTVRDRVVQAALKIAIEPVFEADFLPCSFGFRPRRSAHDALQVLIDEAWQGRRWVVETDIASCFEEIGHQELMAAVEERIVDRHVLKLVRAFVRAGVMDDGQVRGSVTGTPQGGVISPLLANVYLHRLDRCWDDDGVGVLVRYADDLVVMCHTRQEATAALGSLEQILAGLGLRAKTSKTQVVHLTVGGQGIDFLGFHHRWVRARSRRFSHVRFLARWPSNKAMSYARDRIRALTDRSRLQRPLEDVVEDLNRFLRGWAGYFRYGNSARHFDAIRNFTLERLAGMVAKRHRRSRAYGWSVIAFQSDNQLDLIGLDGIVVAPRPNRDWRG